MKGQIGCELYGDEDIFGNLIYTYQEQGYKLAYIILKNEDQSVEAYLNAVEKAYKYRKKVRHPEYFKTWFMRIVMNEAKNILKKQSKVIRMAKEEITPCKENEVCENLDLNNALRNLPLEVQDMIKLKYYLGYTLKEISEVMGQAEGTIKTKIYGALKKIKSELEVKTHE